MVDSGTTIVVSFVENVGVKSFLSRISMRTGINRKLFEASPLEATTATSSDRVHVDAPGQMTSRSITLLTCLVIIMSHSFLFYRSPIKANRICVLVLVIMTSSCIYQLFGLSYVL